MSIRMRGKGEEEWNVWRDEFSLNIGPDQFPWKKGKLFWPFKKREEGKISFREMIFEMRIFLLLLLLFLNVKNSRENKFSLLLLLLLQRTFSNLIRYIFFSNGNF